MAVSRTLLDTTGLIESIRSQRASRSLASSRPQAPENVPLSSHELPRAERGQTLRGAQESPPTREGRRRAYTPEDPSRRPPPQESQPPERPDKAAQRRDAVQRAEERRPSPAQVSTTPSPSSSNTPAAGQSEAKNAPAISASLQAQETSNSPSLAPPSPGVAQYARVSALYQARLAPIFADAGSAGANPGGAPSHLEGERPAPVDISA